MNIVVPDMMQNALTGKMTVDQAADDAAEKVEELCLRRSQPPSRAGSAASPA